MYDATSLWRNVSRGKAKIAKPRSCLSLLVSSMRPKAAANDDAIRYLFAYWGRCCGRGKSWGVLGGIVKDETYSHTRFGCCLGALVDKCERHSRLVSGSFVALKPSLNRPFLLYFQGRFRSFSSLLKGKRFVCKRFHSRRGGAIYSSTRDLRKWGVLS